ncbi:MAG: sodium ion-translocating decarboxylase subunit beta [Lachnospiraceae bacterium]|jgi:oxaloacetate decarboxylase beta subunit|nr:sodium ion-translocating decarboxylase subunit beta [Lachnospiraceae bacterium]
MSFIRAILGSLLSLSGPDAVRMLVMWAIGGILIYLAVKKDMEPTLLLPMGFGAILVNLPLSGAITQVIGGVTEEGALSTLFAAGIANELFPLILFIGIGAMIDFGPLLQNPKLLLFGAAAQFGIFFTLLLTAAIGQAFPGTFTLQDAASVSIIGAADGPTAIFVANYYGTKYMGAILVAAYSYMALVPIIQPPCIRLITTQKERRMRMPYTASDVPKSVRILFPIAVSVIAGLVAPRSVSLVGFLMFGNLLRECGVLDRLSETARDTLANLVTIFLGITVAVKMQADLFLTPQTILIMCLGLFAFVFDTIGGVLFAKFINLFSKNKVNPMIGACGISAFPMSSRVVHKMGLAEDNQNFLLMHATGVNVGGQIASVIAGGLVLNLIGK